MNVAIVKYNAGNVVSVENALRVLGVESTITDDASTIISADRVIFPGVGEASSAMDHLRQNGLTKVIKQLKQPVLAICLGMQLLTEFSDENDTACLGIAEGHVRRFSTGDLKVPHMGWNNIHDLKSPIFQGVDDGSRVYFVHSFYLSKAPHTVATSSHGTEFSAAIQINNFFGVQFHPEKSGEVGSKILENFINL
jgi:imidazole glycerol-phosphate synthase subunit HisH